MEVAEVLPSFSRPVILHKQIRAVHEQWYLIRNKSALNLGGNASSSRRTNSGILAIRYDSRRLVEHAEEFTAEDQ